MHVRVHAPVCGHTSCASTRARTSVMAMTSSLLPCGMSAFRLSCPCVLSAFDSSSPHRHRPTMTLCPLFDSAERNLPHARPEPARAFATVHLSQSALPSLSAINSASTQVSRVVCTHGWHRGQRRARQVMVVTAMGVFYQYQLDPIKGGECKLLRVPEKNMTWTAVLGTGSRLARSCICASCMHVCRSISC